MIGATRPTKIRQKHEWPTSMPASTKGKTTGQGKACLRQAGHAYRRRELTLTVQVEGGGLEIAMEFQVQAVIHPPGAGCRRGRFGTRIAFDHGEFILRAGIETQELQQR